MAAASAAADHSRTGHAERDIEQVKASDSWWNAVLLVPVVESEE